MQFIFSTLIKIKINDEIVVSCILNMYIHICILFSRYSSSYLEERFLVNCLKMPCSFHLVPDKEFPLREHLELEKEVFFWRISISISRHLNLSVRPAVCIVYFHKGSITTNDANGERFNVNMISTS